MVGIHHSRASDSDAGLVPERQHHWPEPLEQGRWLAGSSRACWRQVRAGPPGGLGWRTGSALVGESLSCHDSLCSVS